MTTFSFHRQNFLVKIQNATISAVDDAATDDFSAKLQLLTVLFDISNGSLVCFI